MNLKIKLLDEHVSLPTRAHPDDAGLDLTATSIERTSSYVEYGTSIAVEIPRGYAGFLMPRSSISKKTLILANSVGLIDSQYRGEIKARFKVTGGDLYKVGEKIAQLVIVPIALVTPVKVDKLSDTSRGSGGFGSTGA
jgi:dUTP pyrophosphatase